MDKLRHADGGALQRPGDHGDHLGRLSGGRDLALRTISLPLFDPFSPDLIPCFAIFLITHILIDGFI